MLCIVLSVCLPNAHECWAGSGTTFKLPQGKKRVKNGITVEVNNRWIDGVGCRPIKITFNIRKTNADRTLRVDILPNSYSSHQEPLRFSTQIEIPAGERKVTETIFVPQDQYYSNYIRLEFYEDGRYLEDLSMSNGEYWNSQYYNNGERPCVLFVDADAPSVYENRVDVLAKLRKEASKTKKPSQKLPRLETVRYLSIANAQNGVADELDLDESSVFRDIDSLRMIGDTPNLELIHPMDVPESYVGLNSVDLMVFSKDDLASLAEESPARFGAIDKFVRNGGNLIVYGTVTDKVSYLFGQSHAWKKAIAEDFYKTGAFSYTRDFSGLDDVEVTPNQKRRRILKELKAFPDTFVANHGLGRLVVSTSEDPYALSPMYWTLLESEIDEDRLSWTGRHGVQYNTNNQDFWDFLIPGYGATPVVSFLTVIALFVICIGPINFIVLKRIKRFYLLPFTVAVAAIATTTAMMVYALLSDGVTQRARLRSFTSLEEKIDGTHVAAIHCRHAYLAAVAPMKGLVFPEHVMAFEIPAQAQNNPRNSQRITRNSQKEYYQGYIGSRSTSQILTTAVSETTNRIAVTRDEDGEVAAAKNDIGVSIKHAWLIDANGKISYATNCDNGESLDLSPIDKVDARKAFTKVMAANRPEPPEGLDKNTVMGVNWGVAGAGFDQALLASEMSDSGQDLFKQTSNTYILVTEEAPPFLAKGLADAVEEAGFHLIRGKWSP